jgi:glycosyltransferase involved in cell wall biosynthesis
MTKESSLRISVVTPSYNYGRFLEHCIRSVVSQNYSDLEHIVIDGGSTDQSLEVIRKYESQLAYWVSEPDNGQYDALNKGFGRATGDILAWLNADDLYTPWTFLVVAEIFRSFPEVEWVSSAYPLWWDERGAAVACKQVPGFSRRLVLGMEKGIQQESTFWRRSLWERAGGYLDTSYKLAADFELWARFWLHTELYGVSVPLAGIRLHEKRRAVVHRRDYMREAEDIMKRYGGKRTGKFAMLLRRSLYALRVFIWPKGLRRRISELMFFKGKLIEYRDRHWRIQDVHFI